MTEIRESKAVLKEEIAVGPVTEGEVDQVMATTRSRGVIVEDEEGIRTFLFLNPEVARFLSDTVEEAQRLLPNGSTLILRLDETDGDDALLLLVVRLRSYESGIIEVSDHLMQRIWDRVHGGVPFTVTSDFIYAS